MPVRDRQWVAAAQEFDQEAVVVGRCQIGQAWSAKGHSWTTRKSSFSTYQAWRLEKSGDPQGHMMAPHVRRTRTRDCWREG